MVWRGVIFHKVCPTAGVRNTRGLAGPWAKITCGAFSCSKLYTVPRNLLSRGPLGAGPGAVAPPRSFPTLLSAGSLYPEVWTQGLQVVRIATFVWILGPFHSLSLFLLLRSLFLPPPSLSLSLVCFPYYYCQLIRIFWFNLRFGIYCLSRSIWKVWPISWNDGCLWLIPASFNNLLQTLQLFLERFLGS